MATANKNIWFPTGTTNLTPMQTPFATLAQSVDDALVAQDKTIPGMPVADVTARNTLYPNPVAGNKVWRLDLGYLEVYYTLFNATTNLQGRSPAGWYPAISAPLAVTRFTWSGANVDDVPQYPPIAVVAADSTSTTQATAATNGFTVSSPGTYNVAVLIRYAVAGTGRNFIQVGEDSDPQRMRSSWFAGEDQGGVNAVYRTKTANQLIPVWFYKKNGSLAENVFTVNVTRLA